MEKRLIPLDCRPIRFFCNRCERSFAVDDEPAERQRSTDSVSSVFYFQHPNQALDTECLVDCTRCGSKCNVLSVYLICDPTSVSQIALTDAYADMSPSSTTRATTQATEIFRKKLEMQLIAEAPASLKRVPCRRSTRWRTLMGSRLWRKRLGGCVILGLLEVYPLALNPAHGF